MGKGESAYAECARRAIELASSEAFAAGGGNVLKNAGNAELYLFLR